MQAGSVDQEAEPEKYELSRKLLKSYYIGLALSDQHLGGVASMTEIRPFQDQRSQEIREEIKQEVNRQTKSALTLAYERAESRRQNLVGGNRELDKKRHSHLTTTRKMTRDLHDLAQRTKREGQGTATEKDKIYSMNQFASIKEEEGEEGDE